MPWKRGEVRTVCSCYRLCDKCDEPGNLGGVYALMLRSAIRATGLTTESAVVKRKR